MRRGAAVRGASLLVRHELRLWASLLLWAARRTHGPAPGDRAFGYARGQGPTAAGLVFVCAVETLTMSVLLRDWPLAHHVALVLDLYALVIVAGLYAACVVRPHVLEPGALRLRRAVHADLRLPLERIASVRREARTASPRALAVAEGVLELDMGGQTSVTLTLTGPVAHTGFFGRRRAVRVVRCHADDADGFVRAVAEAVARAGGGHAVP